MDYNYKSHNKKALAFVKELSLSMKPDEAVLVDALKENPQHASGEHYTFSCYLPSELRQKLKPITEKLRSIDPTLVLNDPELYHLTVFWCSIDKKFDTLIQIFKEELSKQPLVFSLYGLVILPFGISLKAYPLNDCFLRLREKLYTSAGLQLPLNPDGTLHERATSTWITLARYTKKPSSKLREYIISQLDLDFGEFTPESFGVYISNNKYLYEPKTLEVVTNKLAIY